MAPGHLDTGSIASDGAASPRTAPGWQVAALVLLALSGPFLWLGVARARTQAPAVDEVVDLTASLVTVSERDLRMAPEHGILPHAVAGLLPSLLGDPEVPKTEAYEQGAWLDYTEDLVVANREAGRLADLLLMFRISSLLVAAGTAFVICWLATELAGPRAGVLAGGLWLLSPYVLGLAGIGVIDVWYAAALSIAAVAATVAWRSPSRWSALAFGMVLGGTLLVRHHAVVLVPAAMCLVAFRARHVRREALVRAALVATVACAVVWGMYRAVQPTPAEGVVAERYEQLVAGAREEGLAARVLVSAPLPIEWRAGAGYLVLTNEERASYVAGEARQGAPIWYLAANAVLKLPLTTTALVIVGAAAVAQIERARRRPVLVALAATVLVEAAVLHMQSLGLGLRLGLPLLAGACVLAGSAVMVTQAWPGRLLVGGLVVGQLTAFALAQPHPLAWTPPPMSDGYRWLSDSSIDVGQGADELRDRHERSPFVAATTLEPRGAPALEGVPRVSDVPADQLVGLVAVGASALTVYRADELAWLRAYCPVEVIADSILVYRFAEPPLRRPGPDVPAPPCPGGPDATSTRESG